ncbi:MAG: N-acetyltransferase family protein [Verrucomicrobiaceae bacterium]
MTEPLFRAATRAELPAINAIYNHYVLHSTCTYQTVPSTSDERAQWFAAHGEKHPVIVAELGGIVIGWGSLSKLHERQAFANSVEDSIYLHHEHTGRGIGGKMLVELLRLAKLAGHHTVLGAICSDQAGSIALHEKLGFEKVARLREVGYKFDRWLDLVWMQKML